MSNDRDDRPERPRSFPSRAARITLFEDRAEVTRTAKVDATAGASWIALEGISLFVDERTVQAKAEGEGVRVLAARVRFHAHREKALGREAIEALETERKDARLRRAEAGRALDRAERSRARAEALGTAWRTAAEDPPRGARAKETLAAWRESLASIEQATLDALGRAAESREIQSRAEDDERRAEARLSEGLVEKPRYEARIEVELECASAREITVEVTYRVPNALWRPEHVVRLPALPAAGSTSAPVEIVTMATAWQRTGESWDDVEVRFSTARPARAATPPDVHDDKLTSRRKTDFERSRIEVDLREQAVMIAGLDRGTRAVDEMPGVDDGGEPVILAPREKVSIAGTGRPFRVEVGRTSVDATLEWVLFPEIARAAHLRATATLQKGGPLLAGPVRVVRGRSLMGLGRLGFVGRGEPFEIGLGTDDGVRVRRVQTEQRETTSVTGTQKIRRTVKVYLSNLSNEPRKVLVTERVPVSEIDDVEITVGEPGGFKLDSRDGFLRREVDLAGHATEALELGYELRAGSKVVLPA